MPISTGAALRGQKTAPAWVALVESVICRVTSRFPAMAKKPNLQVIQGDVRPCTAWLDFPATVVARSPFDKGQTCRLRLSRADAMKAAEAYRLQPIWETWSVVVGEPPPVPNVKSWGVNVPAEEGLTELVEAHACFRGIRRAIAEDDNGDHMVAYILKPRFFYEHATNMVCAAAKRATPAGLVYVAYARLDEPHDPNSTTVGVVTHGGFVEVDSNDPLLPVDHDSRYVQRLW
jgi:hypothetical protein